MKQLFINDGKVVVGELTPPPLDARSILVETCAAAISVGTETRSLKGSIKSVSTDEYLHLAFQKYKDGTLWPVLKKKFLKTAPSTPPRLTYGNPTGYSCAGRVLEVGELVTDVEPGDRVACAGSPHAEIVSVPNNLFVRIPDNVSDIEASFVSLGSISLHAVRQAGLTLGETVIIMGLGIIGQLAEQVARASGVRTIAIDLVPERVDVCRRNGAHLVLDPNHENILSRVLEFTEGVGADAVLLCMGGESSEPIKQALTLLRPRGRLVVVGTPRMDIPRGPFFQKEVELRIARSYGPGRYDLKYEQDGQDYPIDYVRWTERRNMAEFLRLVSDGYVDIKSLVTNRYEFDQAPQAYQTAIGHPGTTLGIVLTLAKSKVVKKLNPVMSVSRRKIGVAVIGAGNFTRAYHLPNIGRIPSLELKTIVASHRRSAKRATVEFNAKTAATNFTEALRDQTVDLMVISTPHNLHATQSIAALKQGKAVFCEKPMGMNPAEVHEVVKAVQATGGFYAIGFNRRYSPVIIRAKELLAGRKGPLVLNYRIMGTFVPADHWVYDLVKGGGRIIGEACHFFDLLCHIVDSEPVSLTAIGGTLSHSGTNLDDNLICTVNFADGSIASLVYGDLGMAQYPKEYLEIFAGEGVLAVDDFRELKVYGFSGQKGMSLPLVDKGHMAELQAVTHALLNGAPSPIDAKAGQRAMKCSFAAIAALRDGEIQHIKIEETR